MKCPFCSKVYKTSRWLEIHKSSCQSRLQNLVEDVGRVYTLGEKYFIMFVYDDMYNAFYNIHRDFDRGKLLELLDKPCNDKEIKRMMEFITDNLDLLKMDTLSMYEVKVYSLM